MIVSLQHQINHTKSQIMEAKEELIKLSSSLKIAKDLGQLPEQFHECETTNQMLIEHYGITGKETGTFKQWLEKGFVVRKGEKSYKIWSSPIKAKKTDIETSEEKGYKFFNVCFIFTFDQVDPVGKKVE